MCLMNIYILFKLSFWVIKTSQLMLYSEIIAVCSEIHTKHINTLCGQNIEFGYDKPGGTYCDHWSFEGLRTNTLRIHIEKSNKMQECIKIYYSIFIWSSTCFGQHTAHHQEPKTELAASGLHTWKVVGRVVGGSCQAQYALPDNVHQLHVQQPSTYANQRLPVQF
jgi:hypothetical protein